MNRELDAWEAHWEDALHAAAAAGDREASLEALDAMRVVARAQEDLLTQVVTRMALELMLLSFPRGTLGAGAATAPEPAHV